MRMTSIGGESDSTGSEKKEQIARVAIRLFLRKGVAGTGMRDLAKEVGITVGGLYYYFRSKDEVIDTIVARGVRSVEELKEYRGSLGDVSIAATVRACMKYWLKRGDEVRDYLLFYTRESLMLGQANLNSIMNAVRDFIHFFEGLLLEGVDAGEFEIESPALVAFNIWALEGEWALRRWLLRDLFTIDEYAELQTEGLMRQILPCAVRGRSNITRPPARRKASRRA